MAITRVHLDINLTITTPTGKMISVVSTIFNDCEGLKMFFVAMKEQTTPPDEIIIVDAGSKDGSWELIQAEASNTESHWIFRAIQEVRCNVARGRNLAIEAAAGELIVSTDIGCEWAPEWLEELAAPMITDPKIDLVNGSWAVKKEDLVGSWALTEWALKGDQRLQADAISHSSSRSIAYRKSTWEALGGYPEDLTLAADDAVFCLLVERGQIPRVGASDVRCWWHRHELLGGFFKEAFRYGVGDGEAGIRARDLILIGGRTALEAIGLVFGFIWLAPSIPGGPWIGLLFLMVAIASVCGRATKMRKSVTLLRGEKVDYPLLRLLIFTYGTKWHWLRGYFKGFRHGKIHCLNCHQRLATMTPEFYHSRLE